MNDLWTFNGTEWKWIKGSYLAFVGASVYGTKGLANASNTPGPREFGVSWTSLNNLWLFGGVDNTSFDHNDLWRFDGKEWAWMYGADTPDQQGIYGAHEGVVSSSIAPGARHGAAASLGTDGNNLWLWGGMGFDSIGEYGKSYTTNCKLADRLELQQSQNRSQSAIIVNSNRLLRCVERSLEIFSCSSTNNWIAYRNKFGYGYYS